jgi:hypothetical protein
LFSFAPVRESIFYDPKLRNEKLHGGVINRALL